MSVNIGDLPYTPELSRMLFKIKPKKWWMDLAFVYIQYIHANKGTRGS
jgi:hypothetical protein